MKSSAQAISWNGHQVSTAEYAVVKQHGINQLASCLPTAAFSHSAMPIFLYFVFADSAGSTPLGVWVTLNLLFAALSGALFILFRKGTEKLSYDNWYVIIGLYFLFRSILLSTIVFFVPMQIHAYTYIIISMLTVFIAVGVITLSRHAVHFLLYTLPMLVIPVAAVLMHWQGEPRYVALAYAVLFIPVYIAFRSSSHSSAGNMVFKLRSDNLTNQLAMEKEQAEMARDVAIKANLSKSRFFAAANHDLRQPLYALSLLSRQLGKIEDPAERERLHKQITSSIGALCTMLDSLLDMSQLDSNHITPEITTVSLREIFLRVKADLSLLANNKGIEFHTVQTSVCTLSDYVQLERMIRNIVHNAVKYTERGKVVLGIRHRSSHYEIQVIDTGSGIDERNLNLIFDEFYQIDNSERDRENGVGLGLSIVKRLSLLLNHEVSIKSSPGHGSCFSIFVTKAKCLQHDLNPNHSSPFNLKEVITLIVDDDASVLQGLGDLLEEWNATVFRADSGDEATRILEHEGVLPDILICDYRLRGSEIGTDVISQLRDILEHPVPAILLTADPLNSIDIHQNLADIVLIQKPANSARILQTIHELTNHP